MPLQILELLLSVLKVGVQLLHQPRLLLKLSLQLTNVGTVLAWP